MHFGILRPASNFSFSLLSFDKLKNYAVLKSSPFYLSICLITSVKINPILASLAYGLRMRFVSVIINTTTSFNFELTTYKM